MRPTFFLRCIGSLLFLLLLQACMQIHADTTQPSIHLPTPILDTSIELGRSGNALRVQDPDQYLSSPPLLYTESSSSSSGAGGISSLTLTFFYRQLIPGKYSPIAEYSVPPKLVENASPLAMYTYLVLTVDLGGGQFLSDISSVFDGNWHSVVFDWESSEGNSNWYIDGILSYQTPMVPGYLMPWGGVFTIGRTRFTESLFGSIDQVGFFNSILNGNDRNAFSLSSPLAITDALLFGVGGILSRNNAIVFYSFDQPLHLDSNLNSEIIFDMSGNGHHGVLQCTTHCRSSMVIPSIAPAWFTNQTTILVPVTGQDSEYILYLANSNSTTSTSAYATNSVTITSLPTAPFSLFRVSSTITGGVGTPIYPGDSILSKDMNSVLSTAGKIAVVLRVDSGFSAVNVGSFGYSFTPAVSTTSVSPQPVLNSIVNFVSNHLPSAAPPPGWDSATSSTDVNPDPPSVQLTVDELSLSIFLPLNRLYPSSADIIYDQDGMQILNMWITELPSEGILYQVNDADLSQGSAITSASLSAPVMVTGSNLQYLAPAAQTDQSIPQIGYYVSDGMSISTQIAYFQFIINPLPHLPIVTPMSLIAPEDSSNLITLKLDSTPLDANDFPYVFITSMPQGRIYQVGNGTSKGDLIGDPFARESPPISQWVSEVTNWSSFYPDVNGGWSVTQLIGPTNAFPTYGDNPLAWAGFNTNSAEWVEVKYQKPVYITSIEIFETFNPGHVTNIYAKHPISRNWQLIWHNPAVAPALPEPGARSDILSPSLCPVSYPSNEIRIELASTGYSWAEIDAIRLIGIESSTTTALLDPLNRVWYEAPIIASSLSDPIGYTANSCKYYQLYRQVGVPQNAVQINITRVNHPPTANPMSALQDSTSVLGMLTLPLLQGSDIDGDTVHFRVLTLPVRGSITVSDADAELLEEQRLNITVLTSPLALSGNKGTLGTLSESMLPADLGAGSVLNYAAYDDCDYDLHGSFLLDSFLVAPVDSGSPVLQGSNQTFTIQQYCIRKVQLPSALSTTAFTLSAIGMAICLFVAIFIIRHREEPIIKASSVLFNMLALTGCAGLFVAVIPLVYYPLDSQWCMARWAVPCMSFTLLFSSTFAKTFRIYRIFTNKNFSESVLSNAAVLRFVLTGVAGMAILLLIYGLVAHPELEYSYQLNDTHDVAVGCSTNDVFRGLLIGSQGMLIVWGTFLAFSVRHVPSLFNEGSWIGICIYNSLLLSCLGVGLDFVLGGNQTGQAGLRSFLLLLGVFICTGALFGSKIVQLMQVWAEMSDDTSAGVSQLKRKLKKKYYNQAIKNGKSPEEAELIAAAQLQAYVSRQSSGSGTAVKSGGGVRLGSNGGIKGESVASILPVHGVGGGPAAKLLSNGVHATGARISSPSFGFGNGTLGSTNGGLNLRSTSPINGNGHRVSLPISRNPRLLAQSLTTSSAEKSMLDESSRPALISNDMPDPSLLDLVQLGRLQHSLYQYLTEIESTVAFKRKLESKYEVPQLIQTELLPISYDHSLSNLSGRSPPLINGNTVLIQEENSSVTTPINSNEIGLIYSIPAASSGHQISIHMHSPMIAAASSAPSILDHKSSSAPTSPATNFRRQRMRVVHNYATSNNDDNING